MNKYALSLVVVLLLLATACTPGFPRQAASLDELVRTLEVGGSDAKIDAAEHLRDLGPRAAPAVPVLIETLSDPDELVGRAARDALVSVGPAAVRPMFEALGSSIKDKAASRIVDNITAGLFAFGPDCIQEFGAIFDEYAPGTPERAAIVSIVARLASRHGAAALGGARILIEALGDPSTPTQIVASGGLRKLGPATGPKLAEALSSTNGDVRFHAAILLGDVGSEGDNSVDALVAALQDPIPRVRLAAKAALEKRGIPFTYVPTAAQRLQDLVYQLMDDDPQVRARAAEGLGEIGGQAQSALGALRVAAEDPDPRVRTAALTAIAQIQAALQ